MSMKWPRRRAGFRRKKPSHGCGDKWKGRHCARTQAAAFSRTREDEMRRRGLAFCRTQLLSPSARTQAAAFSRTREVEAGKNRGVRLARERQESSFAGAAADKLPLLLARCARNALTTAWLALSDAVSVLVCRSPGTSAAAWLRFANDAAHTYRTPPETGSAAQTWS